MNQPQQDLTDQPKKDSNTNQTNQPQIKKNPSATNPPQTNQPQTSQPQIKKDSSTTNPPQTSQPQTNQPQPQIKKVLTQPKAGTPISNAVKAAVATNQSANPKVDDTESKSVKQYVVKTKRISIRTSDGSTLVGKVNIGEKERVSDIFTKTENPFVVLFDAESSYGCQKTFFINKSHIVWVEPED